MQRDEIKVLIVAPNVCSLFGGEAFLPLKYFQILLKRGYTVRLIAHHRNKANLEELFDKDKEVIFFIEDSIYHRAIWNIGKIFPSAIRTILFNTALNLLNEVFQSRLIRKLVDKGLVDIIHQPIPVSPKTPSSLFGFGVPVVIGPMNGGMSYPPGYEEFENKITQHFISFARQIAILLNLLIPGKLRAAALLVANERTQLALPIKEHPKVIKLVENGVDLSVWRSTVEKQRCHADDEFRLAFMGRLIALKAMDITINALKIAREKGANVTLDIIGDGEERARLEFLCQSLNLSSVVRFHGFLPQPECALVLQDADALILNSLRECGGAVVLEAMSLGLPVIASDWGGPADYLDSSCGILVSPVPRFDFAVRLSDAILELVNNPESCREMGEAGRRKIHAEFDWEKKVDRMVEVYHEALNR